jgi:2-keto-4-pentenoate hydratase
MPIWEDERVRAGLARQLATRRALLDDGAEHLGWKVGVGTPAAMAAIGTDGPLVGFLTRRGELAPGAEAVIADWGAPVAEAEIAVRLGTDLEAGATRERAAAAVDAVAPAIELADVAGDRTDVEAVVAGNVFHRHVLLGPWDPARAGLDAATRPTPTRWTPSLRLATSPTWSATWRTCWTRSASACARAT